MLTTPAQVADLRANRVQASTLDPGAAPTRVSSCHCSTIREPKVAVLVPIGLRTVACHGCVSLSTLAEGNGTAA
jgi:hypothetical protein